MPHMVWVWSLSALFSIPNLHKIAYPAIDSDGRYRVEHRFEVKNGGRLININSKSDACCLFCFVTCSFPPVDHAFHVSDATDLSFVVLSFSFKIELEINICTVFNRYHKTVQRLL